LFACRISVRLSRQLSAILLARFQRLNKFVEKLAEVAKEHYKNETNTIYEDFLKDVDSEPIAEMREIKEKCL